MQNQDNPSNMIFVEEETTNIRHEIEKYAYYWKWFLLAVILALLGAYFQLRYTPNVYQTATTILVGDDAKGGMAPDLAVFEELGIGGNKKNIENEMIILKSSSLMEAVSQSLMLNVSYFREGQISTTEILKNNVPFKINFLTKTEELNTIGTAFKVQIKSPTQVIISDLENNGNQTVNFGEPINFNGVEAIITPKNQKHTQGSDIEYIITITPIKQVAQSLRNQVQVHLLNNKASVIELILQSKLKAKAQNILDEIVRQYNKEAVAYKSQIGNNTDAFIKERLAVIEEQLINVDKEVQNFKTSNKLTDIATETGLVLTNNSEIEKEIINLNTQLKLVDFMTSYLTNNTNALIPENLGITASEINDNSNQYNTILLERARISKSTGKNNPVIVNLDSQLEQLRAGIMQALINFKSSLKISLNQANAQEQRMAARISTAPRQEREYRDIQRQQQIIETLYLFLLQKREENAITLAVTLPNAKVIDKAESVPGPISPNRKSVYLKALLLGLIIPFGIIFLINFLDNKIHTQKELEAATKAPFIGAIPTAIKEDRIILKEDRGSLAEAFRMLRTNVIFMLGQTNKTCQTIFVTSTIPGEGKTFVTINMATVMAMTGKKVLLIGADIRKPKVGEYLKINESKKGLTIFLADKSVEPHEIIEPQEWGIDVIQSGIIAPNPAELLLNGRLDELLAYSKEHYDYVIVDTAPVNMVTDTLQIASKADLFIYIVRANYLDKRLLEIPKQLYKEQRLPNMTVVMNGVNTKKGYGYGYGYGEEDQKSSKKPWYKRS